MKKLILLLLLLTLAIPLYAQDDPFPQNRDTEYAYTDDDIPEVCFFGKGARWDGYAVTARDWYKLTDFQKTMFISEAAKVLKVDIDNGWEVLINMNTGASKIRPGFSMFAFLGMLLKGT